MKKTLIIAEAGVNHNGELENAIKLVKVAAQAKADYVKFQAFRSNEIVTASAQKATYQSKNMGGTDNSQLAMLQALEFKAEWYEAVISECHKNGVKFLTTPFDIPSVDEIDPYIDFYKIPSGEITNLPYLEKIAKKQKPVIISTGMSTLMEIEDVIKVFKSKGYQNDQMSLLHCNTEYPTPIQDVNLSAMDTLRAKFGLSTGLSDHSEGILAPIAAVARGAQIIEKHFTLDKTMPGPDHRASLEPQELNAMIESIRNVETMLGDPNKKPTESEIKNIPNMRKSIVAATDIPKDTTLTDNNLTTKRPGTGISPMRWHQVIGTTAVRDFKKDELINI